MKTILLATTLLATPALAQQAPIPDSSAQPADATITVTANRAPTPLSETSASITVLDRATIDRLQFPVVSDLLGTTPGVTIARTGGYGTTTAVRIRGAETDETVAVIDGVRLNDPSSTGGGYDFGDLFVGDAARIEVLRGPQSTLWGSQAIGGVVNVVTTLPTAPLEGAFDLEGGSRGTVDGKVALGGKTGDLAWRLSGNAFRTNGISAIAPRFGGIERDGYSHQGASGRIDYAITPTLALDLRGYYSHGKVDFDASFGAPDTPEYSVSTNWTGYAGLRLDLLDGRLKNRLAVTRDSIDRDNYDPRLTGNRKTFEGVGRNTRVEYQGALAIADNISAIFGAEHEHSRFTARSPQFQTVPDRGDVSIDSGYGQLTAKPLTGLTLTGSVRYDHHQTFGGKTLFSAGGTYVLGHTTIRANYGEGFKAPSLYQLYSAFGNTALRPEQAHGWDAGVEQALGEHLTLTATYFDRDTRNLVTFGSLPVRADRPFGYYQNVARANAHGIEAGGAAHVGGLTVDANYSWIDAQNRSAGANYGRNLQRRPHQTANGGVTYRWPVGLSTGVAVRHASHSFEDAANTTRLGAYTLVDLRAEYPLNDRLALFARIENVGDKDYETAYRYQQLGRSVFGGIRGRF